MMKQRIAGIAVSVALALVGTGLLVAYVQGAEDRALRDEAPKTVLVVKDTIKKGTSADSIASLVDTEKVPAKVVADGALASLTPISGQVAVTDLLPGEQLVAARFAAAGEVRSSDVPPGLQEVTVPLDAYRVLAGQLRAGDTVGVVSSFDVGDEKVTHFILHKIKVTNVRNEGGEVVDDALDGTAPVGKMHVTLAMDAPSVEKLVFTAEYGRLWLTSEPLNANEAGTKIVTLGEIYL